MINHRSCLLLVLLSVACGSVYAESAKDKLKALEADAGKNSYSESKNQSSPNVAIKNSAKPSSSSSAKNRLKALDNVENTNQYAAEDEVTTSKVKSSATSANEPNYGQSTSLQLKPNKQSKVKLDDEEHAQIMQIQAQQEEIRRQNEALLKQQQLAQQEQLRQAQAQQEAIRKQNEELLRQQQLAQEEKDRQKFKHDTVDAWQAGAEMGKSLNNGDKAGALQSLFEFLGN